MTAQELRIGNIVEYNGMYLHVSEIYSPKPRKPKKFDGVECLELLCDGLITVTVDEVNPIPLAKEILLKCGFEEVPHKEFSNSFELPLKRNKKIYVSDIGNPNFMMGIVECNFETGHVEDVVNIHNWDFEKDMYLHQLQNIFYSLTQTELEVNI